VGDGRRPDDDRAQEGNEPAAGAEADPPGNPLDAPTEPEIAPPQWPPDEDPFVESGLYDDLI
jgi:hypothetical protein